MVKDRNAIREKAYQKGFEFERDNRGCAQCCFAALQEALEMRNPETDAIFRAASTMAGGVAGEADGHCGAYSGGLLMLGYLFGRERDKFFDPDKSRYKARDYASAFHKKFIEEYGSVTCEHIHRKIFGRTYYLRDEDDKAKYMAEGAYVDKCTNVVGKAAGWVVDILADAGELESV